MQARRVRGRSHSVGKREISRKSRDAAGEVASEVRAARSSECRKKSSEHLKWTHLEQVHHCTDLPRQATFPAHTEQGKTGQWLE